MLTNSCLFYKVKLSASKEPILGTMMAFDNNKVLDPCTEARVLPYQVNIHRECYPKSGLRYFYKTVKDKRLNVNRVVPNSMFSMLHKPKSMCTGQETILEFIVEQTPA